MRQFIPSRIGLVLAGVLCASVLATPAQAQAVFNADPSTLGNGGTGLRRMRERLDALYGSRAGIEAIGRPGHGFTVIVTLPFARAED